MVRAISAFHRHSVFHRAVLASVCCLSLLSVTGCSSGKLNKSSDTQGLTTASTGKPKSDKSILVAERWKASPKDIKLGLNYAAQLKAAGKSSRQVQVLSVLAQHHPQNREVQAKYGKALLQIGQPKRAQTILEPLAASAQKSDWQTISALGTAYDQAGEHVKARTIYQSILRDRPQQAAVWNNLGMSYVIAGDPAKAEAVFRQAVKLPNSKDVPEIRQNLALAVGLQGRFEEAKTIISHELPPEQVQANIAHLQDLLSRQNTWQQLRQEG